MYRRIGANDIHLGCPQISRTDRCALAHTTSSINALKTYYFAETFLPFDLEAVFISSISILSGLAVENSLAQDYQAWLHKAYAVFDDLIDSGNLLANQEKQEVLSFQRTLLRVGKGPSESLQNTSPATVQSLESSSWETVVTGIPVGQTVQGATPASHSLDPQNFGFDSLDEIFTSANILDAANAIDTGDAEWMSQTIAEYNLW